MKNLKLYEEVSKDASNLWKDMFYFWWDFDAKIYRIFPMEKARKQFPDFPILIIKNIDRDESDKLGAELVTIDPMNWENALKNAEYDYESKPVEIEE